MSYLPVITKRFAEYIANTSTQTYRIGDVMIVVEPGLFPPEDQFSSSSSNLYDIDYTGKDVLDLGSGPGTHAIIAKKHGAKTVVAVDNDEHAVRITKSNAIRNDVNIHAIKSDLFTHLKEYQFDIIIANLPIVDHRIIDESYRSLCDPYMNLHNRLFSQAPTYLKDQGVIIKTHADLQGLQAFTQLETIATAHKFTHRILTETHSKGYNWKTYEFKRKTC